MTNESHIELDEMQQQFQLLREKLDQQEIVSDKLVSEIVRQKISSLNRDARIIGLIALLGIPYTLFIFNTLHISTVFCIFTTVFLITACVYNYLAHRKLSADKVSRSTFCEVARNHASASPFTPLVQNRHSLPPRLDSLVRLGNMHTDRNVGGISSRHPHRLRCWLRHRRRSRLPAISQVHTHHG